MRFPIVIIASIGLSACGDGTPEVPVSEVDKAAAIEVSAIDLSKAYEANEVAAQEKFGKGPLKVSGKVTGITLDFMDNAVVQLSSTNEFMPVQATLDNKDESKNLAKGQSVTLLCGAISEVVGAPQLSGCSIVTK